MQTAQGIFYLTDIQVSGGFLDKIWKLLTYETPLYHKPLQSYQLSKTVRFFLAHHLRTFSRELEATTGAAAHNLDEEHS